MTEMFGETWSPMSVPDLAPDDDDGVVSELCHRRPCYFEKLDMPKLISKEESKLKIGIFASLHLSCLVGFGISFF